MARKVPFVGIEKLYVSEVISDTMEKLEFGKPQYVESVKKIKVSKNIKEATYSDESQVQFVERTLTSVDVEIDITDLTEEEEAMLLGAKVDKNGLVTYNKKDKGKDVAILFSGSLAQNQGKRYIVLYKGSFAMNDEEYDENPNGDNFQHRKLKGTFMPLIHNGDTNAKIDSNNTNAPKNLDVKFFEKVMLHEEMTTPIE